MFTLLSVPWNNYFICSSCFCFTDIVHVKITMVIGCLVLLHVMVLFLVLHAWYLNTTMAQIFQKMN